MRTITGLLLAGGLVLGLAGESKAQVGISIGNPYNGGINIGTGGYANPYYGYGYGYPSTTTYYNSGYRGYVAPGYSTYNYGYSSPYYGNSYRNYGYGRGYYRGNRGVGVPFFGGRRWR